MDRRSLLVVILAATGVTGCVSSEITPPPQSADLPTSHIKHRPTCSARVEAKQFQKIPKPALTWVDRLSGAITTPLKHFSTTFDGPGGWRDTGCDARGIGMLVRPTQHSTDGLYTLDIAIHEAWVNGEPVPEGTCVRLEVLPGRLAHDALRKRRPQQGDVIEFSGPLIWDKDKKPDFPLGHMEIHPNDPIQFLARQPAPTKC